MSGISKAEQLKKSGTFREKHNRDEKYTEFLHLVPCAICGKLPVETHHVDGRKFGTNDHRQLPLCPFHHRGHGGIHMMGNISFQAHYEIDVYEEADGYYDYYEKNTKGKV